MAESGVGFLVGGSEPPPHQLEDWGSDVSSRSAISSPSGVRGRAPENLDFEAFCDLRNHVRIVS